MTIRRTVLCVLVLLLLAGCAPTGADLKSALPRPLQAPAFTLTDQHGQPFRLADQRGKVVLLFFGYTSCPDVCPTTLATWKQTQAVLGADAAGVRFVFVTVDPERDTPEVLAQHLALFSPDFIGLTSSMEQLDPVYKAYGVYHEKMAGTSAGGYMVSHSANTYLIDRNGLWRANIDFGTSAEDIAHDVRALLR